MKVPRQGNGAHERRPVHVVGRDGVALRAARLDDRMRNRQIQLRSQICDRREDGNGDSGRRGRAPQLRQSEGDERGSQRREGT